MVVIDYILNIAGLLLWLSWRSVRLDPFQRTPPATLAGTVRRAEPRRLERWHFLATLAALLFIRAFFYGELGPAVGWSPKLDLMVVGPAFPLTRGGRVFFLSALLFSILSFVRVLVVFYFWLLAVAVINRRVTNPDRAQKMLLVQLGDVARWPLPVQLVAPFVVTAALWLLCHGMLVRVGVMSPAKSTTLLLEQGVVLGLCLYLTLKFLLVAFLAAHVIVSYVYLGNNPAWEFITTTSRNILSPLNRLPLRVGRMDFAPLIAIIVIVALFYWPVPAQVQHFMDRQERTFWPQ